MRPARRDRRDRVLVRELGVVVDEPRPPSPGGARPTRRSPCSGSSARCARAALRSCGRDLVGNDRLVERGPDGAQLFGSRTGRSSLRSSRPAPARGGRLLPSRGGYDFRSPSRGGYDFRSPSRGGYDFRSPSRGGYDFAHHRAADTTSAHHREADTTSAHHRAADTTSAHRHAAGTTSRSPSRGGYDFRSPSRGGYDFRSPSRGGYDFLLAIARRVRLPARHRACGVRLLVTVALRVRLSRRRRGRRTTGARRGARSLLRRGASPLARALRSDLRLPCLDPPGLVALTRNGHPALGGHFTKEVRRCPTLPQGPPCSTIGAERLSFRVRNVTGRFPLAMAAETLLMFQSAQQKSLSCGSRPYIENHSVDASTKKRCVIKSSAY